MMKSLWKKDLFMKFFGGLMVVLPSPKSITYMWNFGSLLGLILVMQIVTGLLLSFYYAPNVMIAFTSIAYIMRDVNFGWLLRLIHLNGASMFFLICYFHMMRGLYYSSFRLVHTWASGVTIYILLMGTAFLGYVLPWGQMSLWGATVITNLVSTIPILGTSIVQWVWGGFSVNNATLNCFFSLHFLLPFVLLALVLVHLLFLHFTGSSTSMGTFSNIIKVKFDIYFVFKDLMNLCVFMVFMLLLLGYPFLSSDAENFILANPMSSPIHIQPEWYFLYVYAILRSIPNKLGGVIAMASALFMYYSLMLGSKMIQLKNFFLAKITYWSFINIFLLLTWIGSQAVEYPFITLGQIVTILYFLYFFIVVFYKDMVYYLFK